MIVLARLADAAVAMASAAVAVHDAVVCAVTAQPFRGSIGAHGECMQRKLNVVSHMQLMPAAAKGCISNKRRPCIACSLFVALKQS
jgi:hypothetical protein